jgi:hypothetical protein
MENHSCSGSPAKSIVISILCKINNNIYAIHSIVEINKNKKKEGRKCKGFVHVETV